MCHSSSDTALPDLIHHSWHHSDPPPKVMWRRRLVRDRTPKAHILTSIVTYSIVYVTVNIIVYAIYIIYRCYLCYLCCSYSNVICGYTILVSVIQMDLIAKGAKL